MFWWISHDGHNEIQKKCLLIESQIKSLTALPQTALFMLFHTIFSMLWKLNLAKSFFVLELWLWLTLINYMWLNTHYVVVIALGVNEPWQLVLLWLRTPKIMRKLKMLMKNLVEFTYRTGCIINEFFFFYITIQSECVKLTNLVESRRRHKWTKCKFFHYNLIL